MVPFFFEATHIMNEKLVSIFRKLKKERKKIRTQLLISSYWTGEIPSALNETY